MENQIDLHTRDKIFYAALSIFNSKGFTGTTIREIAKTAKVNVSTIFYYFKDKEGLLRFCITSFFEEYIDILEEGLEKVAVGDEVDGLKNVLNEIMNFQYENFQLSRFVWREISIDSQIVRETMTTYFRKERHLFQTFIERGIQNQVFKNIPISITIIQLKGILTMPFLNSIYVSEVWNIYFQEIYYLDQYKKQLEYWVDNFLCVASGANLENK